MKKGPQLHRWYNGCSNTRGPPTLAPATREGGSRDGHYLSHVESLQRRKKRATGAADSFLRGIGRLERSNGVNGREMTETKVTQE